jgi:hypothetical protein
LYVTLSRFHCAPPLPGGTSGYIYVVDVQKCRSCSCSIVEPLYRELDNNRAAGCARQRDQRARPDRPGELPFIALMIRNGIC